MYTIISIIFLLVSIILVSMIMLHQSKNTNLGNSFSLGTSISLFNLSGSDNFITQITSIFAILFFIISLILGNLTINNKITTNKWDKIDNFIKNKKFLENSKSLKSLINSDIPH